MPESLSEYILNARRFRPKDSDNPLVNQTINQLARNIALGNKTKQKSHLKYLLLDLYARYKESINGWIYFSRSSDFYNIPTRYNRMGIAFRPLIAVIDRLLLYGMLEQKLGFYDETTASSFQTRIRPTPELIHYFQTIPTTEIKETHLNDALIRLRTKVIKTIKDKRVITKKFISYEDNDYTNYISEQLMIYNQTIKDHCINLHLQDSDEFDFCETESTEIRVNLNQSALHRVFNDDFSKGGRFYGGWWQNIPKKLRDYILIDGEPTIELDFKGFHIALLYAFKGIDYYADDPNKDPYKVEGFDRSTVKLLLQTILNSKNKNHAKKGFHRARYKNSLSPISNSEFDRLIEIFETMHAPIAKYFHKEQGLYLQNLDSRIAEHVIHDFMITGLINKELLEREVVQRNKVVVLPIHDSFRVQVKYLEPLMQSMKDALELAGREVNYFENREFYNYMPRFSQSDLINISPIPHRPLPQESNTLDVIPELKILYKSNQDQDYFKLVS